MPTYIIKNKQTGKSKDIFMTISDMEKMINSNPHLSLGLTAPRIVSGVDGLRRTDDTFNDMLKEIKKKNRGSTIKTR